MSRYEFFCTAEFKSLLQSNALADFDSLWNLEAQWVEEPNVRRRGWSGVVRHKLLLDNGEETEVYIKRQEGHISKTFAHPLKGILTLKKEFANIQRLIRYDIPTLDPVYFGCSGNRAILVTLGLSEHSSLDQIDPTSLCRTERQKLIYRIADTLQRMHKRHLQHNCLYPKHIFVKMQDDDWNVRIIDLEKMKQTVFKKNAVYRDMSTLFRHSSPYWTTRDKVAFLKYYFNETNLSNKAKKIWHCIASQPKSKRKLQQKHSPL
jgi:hypothetical protein